MSRRRILYGLSGEGRGHAIRALTVAKELFDAGHEIRFVTGGDALGILQPAFRDAFQRVSFRHVSPLRYVYHTDGKGISWLASLMTLGQRWWNQEHDIREMIQDIESWKPDLAICDFEPFLARAAARVGVPVASVDHQHGLMVSDFSRVPSVNTGLLWQARIMGRMISQLAPVRQVTVVSSFHHAPLLPEYQGRVHQVGVFMRGCVKMLTTRTPTAKPFFVAYLRKAIAKTVLPALQDAGEEVKVYGLGSGPGQGKLSFHAIDETRFVEDLATSRGLITGAGNQLVGESLFLRKPVLAIPEIGSPEQEINAAMLADSGLGFTTTAKRVSFYDIRRLLDEGPVRMMGLDTSKFDGLPTTMNTLKQFL